MELPEDDLYGFGGMLDFDTDAGGREGPIDDMFDTLQTCTHIHFCNPPGPDNTHTHSCLHTHTQFLSAPEISCSTGDKTQADEKNSDKINSITDSKKRTLGNREAVRKYRERKKAHTAQLEEQLAKERERNQQLLRRLQAQAALEAEVVRLRTLLSDIRGKIDGEIGASSVITRPYINGRGGESGTAVRLAPVNVNPSRLADSHGQYYLQAVNLPCEPHFPCPQKSSRAVRTHYGTPSFPACDLGHGGSMAETKGELGAGASECAGGGLFGNECPPLSVMSTGDSGHRINADVSDVGRT